MGVYIKAEKASHLVIDVVEKKNEVRLRFNNHDFVRCYTDDNGNHHVEVIDADTGVRHSSNIPLLCWNR